MTEASEKSIAQVAYEALLAEIAKTVDAAEAEHAPAWDAVPQHVRVAIAHAVGEAVRSFAPALICDVTPEAQSFGQVGYQAYIASTGGLNYQGLPCPEWAKLPASIHLAWGAAATAIRSEHEHRFAGDYDLCVSREELAELVASIDAAQRAEAHNAEVAFPLRSRLRAVLFPPEAPAEPVPADDAPPDVPPESPGAATEPPSAES